MSLVAVPARPGLFLDGDFTWTPARLDALALWTPPAPFTKVVGLIGYLPLPNEPIDGTLWTAAALLEACARGYMCGAIQHPLNPGWIPSENLGSIHEQHASAYADTCGFPIAVHLGCDIEGTGGPSYGYGLTWSSNRVQRGGKAQCYHGYQLGQSLSQCADTPDFSSYWRAQEQDPLPGRGDALIQHYPSIHIPGVGEVDLNTMQVDAKGETPLLCAAVP